MARSRAAVYSEHGGPEVLRIVEREIPVAAPGEVLVRVERSGINPTDWKNRRGGPSGSVVSGEHAVPHHDGAGTVAAVGADVRGVAVGDRVWTVLAAHGSPDSGTAQEFAAIRADRVFPLPDEASFDQGASVGIPALTAHRALTVAEGGPERLGPGALEGRTVLVPGGAGAVGHAAIQLARWAGALVIATVSSAEKADLATAAGAEHVLQYTRSDLAAAIRAISPHGVDIVVEVAASANAELDSAVLAPRGVIAMYGNDRGGPFVVEFRELLALNARYQFVLLYTVGAEAMAAGAAAVNAALREGVLAVGAAAGLPLHHFPLEEIVRAHHLVEGGVVGKVLVDVQQ